MNKVLQIVLAIAVLAVVSADAERRLCRCSKVYVPVCGTDRVTYPNSCELTCAQKTKAGLTLKHEGACTEAKAENLNKPAVKDLGRCFCPRDYNPVCASDGLTYSNKCELGCAQKIRSELTLVRKGPCDDVPHTLIV